MGEFLKGFGFNRVMAGSDPKWKFVLNGTKEGSCVLKDSAFKSCVQFHYREGIDSEAQVSGPFNLPIGFPECFHNWYWGGFGAFLATGGATFALIYTQCPVKEKP